MSFLDRIAECNRHDPALYTPFRIGGTAVGRLRRDRLAMLAEAPARDLLVLSDDGVELAPGLDDAGARGAALDGIVRFMSARGACGPWCDEPFPVGVRFGDEICRVDRAGVELFGLPAWGVHANGYVETETGLSLWIPRRSPSVRVCPGKLDNMAAGGHPAGAGVMETLAREADEEAGVPLALAERAAPAGSVSYALDGPHGLKRSTLFVFDLAVPPGFTPVNRDGEVADFALMPAGEAMRRIAGTRDFKFDSALVAIDFFVRRGLVPPDRPDHAAICAGLRRAPPGAEASRAGAW